MSPWLVGLAVAAVVGGIAAASAREPRTAVVGLTLVAIAAPLIVDPFPEPLPLAVRMVGAILAAYVLWAVLRAPLSTRGSTVGWPAEALVALAGGLAGAVAARELRGFIPVGLPGPDAVVTGSPEALATAFALGALAVSRLAAGREAVRLAVGLLLAVEAAALARVGLAGPAPAAEHVAVATLVVAVAGASAALANAAIRTRGSLDLGARHPAAARGVSVDRSAPGR